MADKDAGADYHTLCMHAGARSSASSARRRPSARVRSPPASRSVSVARFARFARFAHFPSPCFSGLWILTFSRVGTDLGRDARPAVRVGCAQQDGAEAPDPDPGDNDNGPDDGAGKALIERRAKQNLGRRVGSEGGRGERPHLVARGKRRWR